jgi:short-subunit dehydrogenase
MRHCAEARAASRRGAVIALITGASSGIGAEFARQLAARRYDLILVARRRERLEKLAAELSTAHGVKAEALAADLTEDAGLKTVEERIARDGGIDLLVNNAGFGVLGYFWETDPEAQDRLHRLHILATMRLTNAALAGMTARNSGAIISVSSVAAFMPAAISSTYGSTKAWINAFTEGLYLELKSKGSAVKMQALCPGFTYTEFHDVARMDRKVIPGPMWLRAENVVAESLRGLDRGKLFVVPGWMYKLIVGLVPALPRIIRDPIILRYSRRRR